MQYMLHDPKYYDKQCVAKKEHTEAKEYSDVVLRCLQDSPDKRPTAEALCLLLKKKEITSFKYGMF